jgi:hypothetical protein
VSLLFQFVSNRATAPACMRASLVILAFTLLWLGTTVVSAQEAPPGAVGRVQGQDISVENGTAANNGTARSAPGIYVLNGSVVTVHSANARMTLFAGGKIDICGPAKFTVLLSGDAITLALNFGRIRVSLPSKISLRVFTPTIIGTPLDISGGSRDVTVGLSLDDSLCVLATSGAIQLANQFSDETLIVPQSGEFFLAAGRLVPVAGKPGSCQCFADEPRPVAPPPEPIPETAVAIPPLPVTRLAANSPVPDPPAEMKPAAEPNIEYGVLAHANEEHPIERPVNDEVPSAPPSSMPIYTVILPPLVYSASNPAPPPDPGPDMAVLIREAQVSPDWEFSGHVAAPNFATDLQHALGENAQVPATTPRAKPAGKKHGFWASIRRLFGGGNMEAKAD